MAPRIPPPDGHEADDPVAIASYIAELTADLAVMARSHGLESLGHLLEMARLEAETLASKR